MAEKEIVIFNKKDAFFERTLATAKKSQIFFN
mgnify:CR=1 FL=1